MTTSAELKNQAVLDYTAAGKVLFPCTPEKKPQFKGWQQTPFDPNLRADSLPPTFGVLLRPDDFVLDVDPRRYIGDENQLVDLWTRLTLPSPIETFIVQTGGAGFHLYFRKPADFPVRGSFIPNHPAIEIKTAGKYVIGAGSVHTNGNIYRVIRGSVSAIIEAPQALLDFVRRDDKQKRESKTALTIDDEHTRMRFVKYLLAADPAIEGRGGDTTTYRVACEGRDYGLPEHTVLELMLSYYNPRCIPPWSEHELGTKVANAFAYAQNEPGCKNPAVIFNIREPNHNRKKAFSTVSATDLMQMEFPEARWAIEPILPEGLTILAGPPKIGKSWMAYSLACAVAVGGKALASYQADQGVVLYLALEDNQRRLQARLRKLTAENGNVSTNLQLSCSIPRFDEGGMQYLERWLNSNPQCRLVIIDTLSRFSPAPHHRMNAYDNDSRVLGEIQKLAISRQIALVLITHLRKQPSTNVLEQVMGSTGITGAADAVWLLKRGKGENGGILSITGRDLEEQELAVEFDKATCQWAAKGDATKYQLGKERLEILEYLEQSDEAVGPKEVAQALGKKEENIKVLMRRMFQQGQIGNQERGKYFATERKDNFDYLSPPKPSQTAT
jgi:RecA-family ATPase